MAAEDRTRFSIAELVRRGYLYTLLVLVLGLVLLIWPEDSVWVVYNTATAGLILMGGWRIVRYFRADADEARRRQYLASGMLRVVAGVLLLVYQGKMGDWLKEILGCVLLVITCIRFQAAFDLKRGGGPGWPVPMAAAALTLVLGIAIQAFSFGTRADALIAGASLIAEALADLYTRIALARIERRRKKEALDAEPAGEPPQEEETGDPAETDAPAGDAPAGDPETPGGPIFRHRPSGGAFSQDSDIPRWDP